LIMSVLNMILPLLALCPIVSLAVSPENLPIVSVKLAPPTNPLPQVSAEVGILENLREHLEAQALVDLDSAFDVALADAKTQIYTLVEGTLHIFEKSASLKAGRPLSFLQKHEETEISTGSDEFAIKISMLPVAGPSPESKQQMDNIEGKRAVHEKDVFMQAREELAGLTDIVLNELGAAISTNVAGFSKLSGNTNLASRSKSVSFLETAAGAGLPSKAVVRVAPSDEAFPKVSDLVQDMENRRDSAESLVRTRILEVELKLLQAENEIIQDALNSAIQRILAH